MEYNDLSKEQWQAIAKKLTEYLDKFCDSRETIADCATCPVQCYDEWITQAKKELGYE